MGSLSSGRELARAYYHELVVPLLEVPHAAGRLGSGSDVLGFDDEMSRDHDWGLRLHVLVAEEHVAWVRERLSGLPESFRGLPTRFPVTWDDREALRVEVMTVDELVLERLGAGLPQTADDWLELTGQRVLEVTAGPVFVDQVGELSRAREALAWYPRDVWLFTMAADLQRIGQELPQIGRADELGSHLLTARVVQATMHLGFLLERQWPPYPKWFGTAYARLPLAREVLPSLKAALSGTERQAHLARALESTWRREPLLEPFFERPFLRVRDSVVEALRREIADPDLRARPLVGSVEQWVSSVDVLTRGLGLDPRRPGDG